MAVRGARLPVHLGGKAMVRAEDCFSPQKTTIGAASSVIIGMNWWHASKGILGLVAGTSAVHEVNKLAKTARIALMFLMGFVGFLTLSLILLDIYLVLLIVNWSL
jgi:hypothetical protein